MLPFLLQDCDLFVQPCQRDVIVEIERVGDLPVDVLTRIGNPFVARLPGARNLLTQLIEFRGIIPTVDRQQQPADIGRFFDRANIGLGECHIGGEVVLVDDPELTVDGACHAHAQQCRSRHQDQQSDSDAKDLQADWKTHGAASERRETGC